MVNKSVLRKLSGSELENYLKEGNRFVPEAVQMAFEILEERGRIFTEQERSSIQQMMQDKRNTEEAKLTEEKETWKDHITDDPGAIRLYSRTTILVSSVFFSTVPGSILLFLNLIKLKKYLPLSLLWHLVLLFLCFRNTFCNPVLIPIPFPGIARK